MRVSILVLATVLLAGCASERTQIRLSDDDRMNAFLEDVRDDVEEHAWERVLEAADNKHHSVQVLEMGMSEPQYVAELFGLHMVDNNIGGGEPIEWDHLRRINALRFETLEASAPHEWIARGHVELDGGERLDVEAIITQREGAYRLSGAVG